MTVRNAADVGILSIEGRVITSRMVRVSDHQEAVVPEITGLGQDDDHYQTLGKKMFTLDVEGWHDDDSGSTDEALDLVGELILMYAPVGKSRGSRCTGAVILRQPRDTVPQEGQFTRVSASYVSNEVDHGVLIQPLSDVSDGQTLTAHDNAAATTNGGVAYLTVKELDLGGFTDVSIKLEHSSNNVTFADLATFADIDASDVPGAERVVVTGTVNQHIRASVSFNGAGTNESIMVAVSFARK